MALLAVALLASLTTAQLFLSNDTSGDAQSIDIPSTLSQACAAPLQEQLQCLPILGDIAMSGWFPSDDDLSHMCTDNCLSSLQEQRKAQEQACTTMDVIESGGLTYPPTLSLDQLIFTFNYTCRKSSDEKYCAPMIESWSNGTATSQQNCSDCYLGTLQTELNSFFGYAPDLAEEFSSLTSSCGSQNYPTISPTSYLLPGNATQTSSAPAATSTACRDTYTIRDGEDCNTVSVAHNVSTNALLYQNNLAAHCVGFPGPGTQLCLPPPCQIYTVKKNDTCYSIVDGHSHEFTATQLVAWNTNLNRACTNMDQLVGEQICISLPGGDSGFHTTATGVNPTEATTFAPIPTDVVSGTNTNCSRYYHVEAGDTCGSISIMMGISIQDFYFLNPEINSTNCNNLYVDYSYCVRAVGDITTYAGYGGGAGLQPCLTSGNTIAQSCLATTAVPTDTYWSFPAPGSATATKTAPSSTSAPTVLPLASGTPDDCSRYDEYIEPQSKNSQNANTCDYISYYRGISIEQLTQWNPSLSYDDSDPDSCSLQKGYRYCVKQGDSSSSPTTTATNPNATPSPVQDGLTSGCTKFYRVVSGDGCYDIAAANDIALSDFYSWNPAVKNDCSGLFPGYYVCVAVKAAPTSTRTSATATTQPTGATTPSPIQDGLVSDCTGFYKVMSGDGCYDIASANKIQLSDFYSWNPAVKDDCSGLYPGYYVCVATGAVATSTSKSPTSSTPPTGVATPTPIQNGMVGNCDKFYEVVSGDGCYNLAQSEHIDLQDFYDWNPAVKNDCSGLQSGYYVCVGVSGSEKRWVVGEAGSYLLRSPEGVERVPI